MNQSLSSTSTPIPTFVMGIDIGGTKIEAVLLSIKSKFKFETLERKRVPTERKRGYAHVLSKIVELIQDLSRNLINQDKSLSGIGIGLPGTVDPQSQVMLNGNTSLFVGQPLKFDIQDKLKNPNVPIIIENDANCFTLAEVRAGAGPLYEKEKGVSIEKQIGLGIILGTGVGGGLIHQGKIFRGRKGGGLEIGHGPLGSRSEGLPCFCGLNGCAETYLSGTGLLQSFKRESGKSLPSHENRLGQSIFEKAQDKNSISYKVVSQYKKSLSLFLLNLTNIFDPDYFVLGGGVSQQVSLYENLEKELREKSFVPESSPKVYKHKLGDSAGVFGAAFLATNFMDSNKIQVQQPL